jgi:hypothetical protein
MNTITVPLGDGRVKTYVSKPEGTWPSECPEWTAAHEAGHLLGLHDMYNGLQILWDHEMGKG